MRWSLGYYITLGIAIWRSSTRLSKWKIFLSIVRLAVPRFFLSGISVLHLLLELLLILSLSLLWCGDHWNRGSSIRQGALLRHIVRCVINRCSYFLSSLSGLSCGFLHILLVLFLLLSSRLLLTTDWISKEAISHRCLLLPLLINDRGRYRVTHRWNSSLWIGFL